MNSDAIDLVHRVLGVTLKEEEKLINIDIVHSCETPSPSFGQPKRSVLLIRTRLYEDKSA